MSQSHRLSMLSCIFLVLSVGAVSTGNEDPRDWTYWRGPEFNGFVGTSGELFWSTGVLECWQNESQYLT